MVFRSALERPDAYTSMAPASNCVMAESEETTDATSVSSQPPVLVVGPASVGASVAAGPSVGAASVATSGASVAVAGAQAARTMLAITSSDNKGNILRILYSPHIYLKPITYHHQRKS